MKAKTDAELIEEAERMEAQPYAKIGPNRVLCAQLARRLKSANEIGEKILGNIKGLLCQRDEGAPTARNIELAGLIAEWDNRNDEQVRND